MSLAYTADNRVIELRGSIALTNSTTLTLSGANIIDYSISEQCTSGQEVTVGDTRSSSYRMTVADESHALTAGMLLGAQVSVECKLSTAENWDKLGVWFVDDCDISRQSAAVSISGSDALGTKFDAAWSDPTYPVTLGNLITRAGTLAGVSTANAGSFRNYSKTVSSAPAWPDGTTIRQVVGYVAQCAGGFARINRAGKLEIVAYNNGATAESIGPDDFFRLRMGKGASFSFNALLIMEMGATEYTRYTVDSSVADNASNSIRIARNPIMTPTIATGLVTSLTGFAMNAVRVEWCGDPTITCGSILSIEDTDESTYTALVTEQTLTISGGMSATSACELPSMLEQSYSSGAVFTPDGKLAMGAVADGSIGIVKISAGAQQALILAAGQALDIGGTNLVQYTGWYSSIGTGWTFTDNTSAFMRYPASTGHADVANSFGGNGFLYWNAASTASGAGKVWSTRFRVVPGEQYTVPLRYRATGLMCILPGRTSANADPTWGPEFSCPDTNADTDFARTVTVEEGIVWMQVVLRCNTNSAGEVGRIKVERGNQATAWSPAPTDPSESVIYGSTIALNNERILLQAPEVYINVSGTSGDMTIDESGVTAPVINSPSVAERYSGPTSISVKNDGTGDYRTLTDAFSVLSGKFIPATVTITLGTNTTEPDVATLTGVWGIGSVNVNLNGKTVNGRISINNSLISHSIDNGTVSASGSTEILSFWRDMMVYVGSVTINGASNAAHGIVAGYGQVIVEGCKFFNCNACISSQRVGRVESVNNTGSSNSYCFRVWDGGLIAWKGTVPSYTTAVQNDTTGQIIPSSPGSGTGGGTEPSAPTVTTTVIASSVATRTYQPSGSGWINSDTSMQQGRNAGYDHYGIIWFGTSGWSGKTIAAATLTLRRLSGGAGSTVTVRLKTVTTSYNSGSPSGNPNTDATDYGAIGTIEQGQSATFSLPVAAVQAVASGTAKGFMLYSDDTGNWGDRSFSRNYAMFAGSGNSSYKPSLTVTYNT